MECLDDHAGKAAIEDTDLGLRASTCARVGRTSGVFFHDVGAQTFLAECREKVRYGIGIVPFHRKHGSRALASHLRRPCLEHPSSLLDVLISAQGAPHATSSAMSLERTAIVKCFSNLSENK